MRENEREGERWKRDDGRRKKLAKGKGGGLGPAFTKS